MFHGGGPALEASWSHPTLKKAMARMSVLSGFDRWMIRGILRKGVADLHRHAEVSQAVNDRYEPVIFSPPILRHWYLHNSESRLA